MDKIRKGAASLPPRIWTFGGAAILIVFIAWFMLAPAQREAPRATHPPGSTGTTRTANGQSPASAASPDARIPENGLAFIQTISLQPPRPSRMDTLKAEVAVAPNAPERLIYTYRWKVNDRVIEEATGDTLILSPFKKGDLITVTVTPNDGSTNGLAVESPLVAIHSVPPSLELKTMRQARKTGEPIELQLVGVAPDGDLVAFSLEPPLVPGMTIDKRSGKISWVLPPDQKGSFRFGASVEDDKGTKVTKTFDITAE
ncbi:MAG: putative Ig domain-containing protein [Deltaproteobacteria bacterium]|nr:putative Ig domain-containing protein [Deltaproteobacteria bacterium]